MYIYRLVMTILIFMITNFDILGRYSKQFQSSLAAGYYVTLDESMVKLLHHSLKGKIKIICKPWTVGNEINNLSYISSSIVLNMELDKGKDIMAGKDYVKLFGATTAIII